MRTKLEIVSTLLILAAASIAAQQVDTVYAPGYDFSKVKTFAVTIGKPWGNPTNEAFAKEEVAKQLTAKGWTQTDPSSADVIAVIKGTVSETERTESYYSGTGAENPGAFASPPGVTGGRVIREKVGNGVIDIFDRKSRGLVFCGVAGDEVSSSESKNQERISRAIEKVFKDFPPKATP